MIGLYYGGNSFGTKVFDDLTSIDFDATLEEVHDWQNEVTLNPVEEGSPVTDHVIEKSDKLKLNGTITNSPLRGPLAGQYFGGDTSSPRTQLAFDQLYALLKKREKVTVYTKHKVYSDMVIQTLNLPRNAQIGDEVQFTMELIHVRFVKTQLVDLPKGMGEKRTGTKAKTGQPKKAAGKTEPKPATPAQEQKSSSVAVNVIKYGKRMF